MPKACKAYRAKTKGKVERPFRYVREDFFLGRSFRNLEDLNAQFRQWLDPVANVRRACHHRRVVAEHFAEETPHLQALPAGPSNAVLRSSAGSPVTAWSRSAAISTACPTAPAGVSSRCKRSPAECNILEDGAADRRPSRAGGRGQRRIAAGHRTAPPPANSQTPPSAPPPPVPPATVVTPRPLAFYEAVGVDSPPRRGVGMSGDTSQPRLVDRIRCHLVGLDMPRALEVLDHVLRRLECGEIGALEAIEALLGEELTLREGRRVRAALKMGRLLTIKTLTGFDFSFQPSLDRNRILTLAQLDFIDRHEVVHFIGQPGSRVIIPTSLRH